MKIKNGTLVWVEQRALEGEDKERHGNMWVVIHKINTNFWRCKSLATGKEYDWFEFEVSSPKKKEQTDEG